MPARFEGAYAYARVCGSLARSYLGDRAAALAAQARVGEVWRGVFGDAPPALPESELADAAERAVRARPAEAFLDIGGALAAEDPFFAALLRKREQAYLKRVLSAIAEGSGEMPAAEDPGFKPGFDAAAFPDLDRMLRRSRYRWIAERGIEDLPAIKNGIDKQYYSELWAAAGEIPKTRAGSLRELLRLEVELENLSWGLRLRRYYAMGAEVIAPLLTALPGVDVVQPTLDALRKRADVRSDWASWRWERLVPDARKEDGGDWYFDVRGFEAAAHRFLARRLRLRLHMEGETYVPLYAYFRIKEFEAEAIQGIIEGIKLEVPPGEIASYAVDTTGGGE